GGDRLVLQARFTGTGNFTVNPRGGDKLVLRASFVGTGDFLINPVGGSRKTAQAIFAGASTLSAVDSIIALNADFEVTSSLQANPSNPIATLMSNPKTRLVFAVKINTIPIN